MQLCRALRPVQLSSRRASPLTRLLGFAVGRRFQPRKLLEQEGQAVLQGGAAGRAALVPPLRAKAASLAPAIPVLQRESGAGTPHQQACSQEAEAGTPDNEVSTT